MIKLLRLISELIYTPQNHHFCSQITVTLCSESTQWSANVVHAVTPLIIQRFIMAITGKPLLVSDGTTVNKLRALNHLRTGNIFLHVITDYIARVCERVQTAMCLVVCLCVRLRYTNTHRQTHTHRQFRMQVCAVLGPSWSFWLRN